MRRVQWGHLAREDSCCIVFWVGEVGQLWVSCKPHLTTETTATQNTISQHMGPGEQIWVGGGDDHGVEMRANLYF